MQKDDPLTIICAEDDDDHFFILYSILEEVTQNEHLIRAKDGEELINILTKNGNEHNTLPSYKKIILLDLNMPKKNGLEVLREIRANPRFHTIPIIILTVSDDRRDIQKSYELGANSYVVKPTDYSQLDKTIKLLYSYWTTTMLLPPKTTDKNNE